MQPGTERERDVAKLYLLFNHQITAAQRNMAKSQLAVSEIHCPPEELQQLWANLPPEATSLSPLLQPVYAWLGSVARGGDFVLVQGDFGACYLVAAYCLARGFVPIYSTTHRCAEEQRLEDGTIRLTHRFSHVIFRQYGE